MKKIFLILLFAAGIFVKRTSTTIFATAGSMARVGQSKPNLLIKKRKMVRKPKIPAVMTFTTAGNTVKT
ncbi:MAG: hypothetical protein ACREOI_21320 [bacterium]